MDIGTIGIVTSPYQILEKILSDIQRKTTITLGNQSLIIFLMKIDLYMKA